MIAYETIVTSGADGQRARRGLGAEGPERLEDVRELDPALERPVVARRDHRAVGDRVGVRDADLDHVRPAATSSVISAAVVGRSGSPAVTNGIRARRPSLLRRVNRVSMRFMRSVRRSRRGGRTVSTSGSRAIRAARTLAIAVVQRLRSRRAGQIGSPRSRATS